MGGRTVPPYGVVDSNGVHGRYAVRVGELERNDDDVMETNYAVHDLRPT